MAADHQPSPAFGEADLSNCEREQIHLAACIQPHGALLLVREPELSIVQSSANAGAFLNLTGDLAGLPLSAIPGTLADRVAGVLADPLDTIPRAVRCAIAGVEHDALLHRPAGGGLVIELERAGPAIDLSGELENALQAILSASSLGPLCDEAARIFKALVGYDRVMIYRFDEDGHGEVFAEQCEPRLESYLGNHYPATDIPHIARRLYERNRVRVLVDVEAAPSPLVPRLCPLTGADTDMSLCFLRSMSPIHVQYLRNMGVRATLVTSLMVGGRLWGLVACHHYVPRFAHFETRAACELLAEALATRIAALDSFVQAQAELSVRRLEQRMIEAIARDGDWRMALFDTTHALLEPVGATGAALLCDGQVLTTGEVPGTAALRGIGAWLDERPRAPVIATASLPADAPDFAGLKSIASGVMAAPISTTPGEYLVWFRPERIRRVVWGGDPSKPMIAGDDPAALSPRRSFAQWHQVVEGTSDAWTPADLAAARLIGATLTDVVLQFRSVRMLIAQDQLAQVRAQVERAPNPVLIADAQGRLLMLNDALHALLGTEATAAVRSIDDLAPLFADTAAFRRRMKELRASRAPWRGEARLALASGGTVPLLVRADPVLSAPGRALGYVLLFTDITAEQAAEEARRRFREGIVEQHRPRARRLDWRAHLIYRKLLGIVVENAQLAALEITDGIDMARISGMLDSVRSSVRRANDVLEHLIWHASADAKPGEARPGEPRPGK
ncbi:MAG: GAF domain-containing protein [Proteobacteria bacterium]|nr:GAF domain-containing protein [Pseudomonadota bacterium]